MKKVLPLSYIELSKKNLIHNITQFKKLAKKGTKFSVAVKGNAYGHGQKEIVTILDPYVDYFQVDSVEELRILRIVSKKRALVMGYIQINDLDEVVSLGAIITIFSIDELKKINIVAQKHKIEQEVQLPIDAYLGREGFLLSELLNVFRVLKKCKHIKLSGVYAHFANIEDTNDFSHAKKQIKEYEKAVALAKVHGFTNIETHISATSGLLVYEKNAGIYPVVRIGIGVYGMWPSDDLKNLYSKESLSLLPVLSWKTKIAQIKTLPKGSTVGYGLTYKTKKETKIAIIPQGYADGYSRRFSNNGHVLIEGIRCNILGKVMMNMCVVDVTHLPKVRIEDEVVMLGAQHKEKITAEEFAKKIDTINYEITTRISALLPRIII